VEYAPDIQFGADRDVAGSLTFRNLLNHSSGVDSGTASRPEAKRAWNVDPQPILSQ